MASYSSRMSEFGTGGVFTLRRLSLEVPFDDSKDDEKPKT